MGEPPIAESVRLAGYRGRWSPPRAGTPLRAAFDAAHALSCGPACPNGPGCREWHPDVNELMAALIAYEAAAHNDGSEP